MTLLKVQVTVSLPSSVVVRTLLPLPPFVQLLAATKPGLTVSVMAVRPKSRPVSVIEPPAGGRVKVPVGPANCQAVNGVVPETTFSTTSVAGKQVPFRLLVTATGLKSSPLVLVPVRRATQSAWVQAGDRRWAGRILPPRATGVERRR